MFHFEKKNYANSKSFFFMHSIEVTCWDVFYLCFFFLIDFQDETIFLHEFP